MKLTLVQQEIVWGNKAHNLATFNAIAEAHYGQTDVLVLPGNVQHRILRESTRVSRNH